jgi:hypothetical protein
MARIPRPVDKSINATSPDIAMDPVEVDPALAAEEAAPAYRVFKDSKVPVSKKRGILWKGRKDQGVSRMSELHKSWDENIRYFTMDQMNHRRARHNSSGNSGIAQRMNQQWSETENIVFANVCSMVPVLYSKNPEATFTPFGKSNESTDELAEYSQQLINILAAMKYAPGINIKPKITQSIVNVQLTNFAVIEVGYNKKNDADEAAQQELVRIGEELATAKDLKRIKELEGQLMALEEQVSFINPPGPTVAVVSSHDIIVDPDASAPDKSDAMWVMKRMYMRTNYLNARYGMKDPDSNQIKSVYEPTHILTGNDESVDDQINNFKLLADDRRPQQFGYNTKDAMREAERTMVWVVWDKATRRVEMYADNNWQFPIWVWDDPYGLPNFYPFHFLQFHTAPVGAWAKGEVSYYLDQQDAINEINDASRRAIEALKRGPVYNMNKVSRTEVENYIRSTADGTAMGIKVPEGQSIGDILEYPIPAFAKAQIVFNKDDKLKAIDRISSVSDTMRGAQFKTNTTNKAIEDYSATTNLRIDEKIDAIEDFVGDIFADVAFLCARFMPVDMVAQLLGKESSTLNWPNPPAEELKFRLAMRVVGGSTQKPTSQGKKKEAIEVGKILGQFVNTAPLAVLTAMLKLFEKAFTDITLTEEDWENIGKEAQQQMQNQVGGAPGQGQGGASMDDAGASRQQPQGQVDPAAILQQVSQIVDGLPDAARVALGRAIEQGIPIETAVQSIMQAMQGQSA